MLGAIRMARHLNLGPDDNVVTIATDGFDRYPSVLADLAGRRGPIDAGKLDGWFESVFRGGSAADFLDVRPRAEKERLFAYKENVWSGFGYSHAYLEQMKSQSFWDVAVRRHPRHRSRSDRCTPGGINAPPRSRLGLVGVDTSVDAARRSACATML